MLKTTTKEGKRVYQRNLMRTRRGTEPLRYWKRGRKPKKARHLLKDFVNDATIPCWAKGGGRR